MIEIVGPDVLTGEAAAKIWSEVLGRDIRYGGDDLDAFEKQAAAFAPGCGWRAISRSCSPASSSMGWWPDSAAVNRMAELLGHAPRSYQDFAAETAKAWQS